MGLLCGCLAAACIFGGLILLLTKRYMIAIPLGVLDMAFVLLSVRGFKEMLVDSGKILTPDWFGLGYEKPIAITYILMFAFGVAIVMAGVVLLIMRNNKNGHF